MLLDHLFFAVSHETPLNRLVPRFFRLFLMFWLWLQRRRFPLWLFRPSPSRWSTRLNPATSQCSIVGRQTPLLTRIALCAYHVAPGCFGFTALQFHCER